MRSFTLHVALVGFVGLFVLAEACTGYAQPRAPQGIYARIDISDYINDHNPVIPPSGDDPDMIALYDSMLRNPAISGLALIVHWDFAQPNPPPAAYNWDYVDAAFMEAAKYGKTIQFIVTAGFNSPRWLWDSTQPTGLPSCDGLFLNPPQPAPNCGTVTFNYYSTKTDQDGNNQTLVLPLPWNTTYVTDWQTFLTALQMKYQSQPYSATLVSISMAGPTAASAEMIMPNNYNTCPSGTKGPCYTCPNGLPVSGLCTSSNGGGILPEDMWNVLFQKESPDPFQPYPQNSDDAFVDQWTKTITFYEQTFQGITLIITPADGTGFPSFGSSTNFTPTTGNVLYDPECEYSYTGGSSYVHGNYATQSCDAATFLLTTFMNTLGGPYQDGMASQTSGMTASSPIALGPYTNGGDTGDVGIPGLKYLANYTLSAGPPQQETPSGDQFDFSFSEQPVQEGCPQGPSGCSDGVEIEQAEYNVLQVFFFNTPGANRFGGATVVGSMPTPRFLQVYQQDVLYAQDPTRVAQPIVDVTTGETFQMSAQDMLNMAKASLFGRLPAHDFSNDGRSDIFWRDNSGDLAIWEMNGGTILNPSNSGLGSVPTAWSVVGQRDFNGDGKADILWRDNSGNLAIWEMNGTTILNPSNSGLGSVPTTWSIVGTGDFNGDGYADILWRNTAGDLAIWEMNGTTILNPNSSGLGNVPTNWSVVGVGDFNGDGKADILWRNNTNGNVAIWLMNGTTVTNSSTATFGNMPLTWSVAGTGDFNGDGNSDIFWEDSSGNLAIWEMNGTTILNPSATGVGSLPTVWSVAVTGDFNGDGMSDILWRDTSGDLAIWYMNGTTISSGVGLGTMPTSWTIQATNAD